MIHHAMLHNTNNTNHAHLALKQEHHKQELTNEFLIASINHEINLMHRGHQNKLMRVGFTAKAFF